MSAAFLCGSSPSVSRMWAQMDTVNARVRDSAGKSLAAAE
jgi:hypothetical protein